MNERIDIDGQAYDVVHSFGPARKIVNYDGLFVLVDIDPTGAAMLSGQPANADEAKVLATLTVGLDSVTIVAE